jgi:hypothetical protein
LDGASGQDTGRSSTIPPLNTAKFSGGLFSAANITRPPKPNELFLETKIRDLAASSSNPYLKSRLGTSLEKIKNFRESITQSGNFHSTLKYLFNGGSTQQRKDSFFLDNKYSELTAIKMDDFDLSAIIDNRLVAGKLEGRLRGID